MKRGNVSWLFCIPPLTCIRDHVDGVVRAKSPLAQLGYVNESVSSS